jgi:hypothetical protein
MPKELSPVEILIKTKQTLKERGWFQGNMVEPGTDGYGAVCFIGAMNVAMRGNPRDCNFTPIVNNEQIALRTIREISKVHSTITWNDNPRRTITEINQVIDQAIETLK